MEEVHRKDKKQKRDETKKEAETATGDNKEEDPDYILSEEGSSQDPLYEPTKKELKRADHKGDK